MAIANITNNILTDSGIATSSLVPYTGATTDVNLGFNNFDANQINGFQIVAKLNGTGSSPLILRTGTSGYSYGNDSISLISSPTTANTLIITSDVSSVTKIAQFGLGSLTATRTFTLPDTSGTIALTSDLSSYLPLTGGTLTGGLSGTTATFSGLGTFYQLTMTGATAGRIFYAQTGGVVSQSGNLNWNETNGMLGVGTPNPSAVITAFSTNAATQFKAAGTAPAFTFSNTLTSASLACVFGLATSANHFVTGTAAGDMAIANQSATAGAIVFGTGTAEKMRMSASGRLLVGTSVDSGALFQVAGAATFSSSVQATNMSIGIAPQTDKLFVYNASGTNTGLTIQQDGTGDIFRANGNSGANRFSITQAGAATFSSTSGNSLTSTSSDFYASLTLQHSGGSNAGQWNLQSVSGTQIGAAAGAAFGIYSNTASAYRLYINPSGSIGIGTSSPAVLLHSSPAATADLVTALFTAGNSDGNFKAGFANGSGTGVASEQAKIGMWYGTSGNPLVHFGLLRGNSADGLGITFNVNNTERMRITSGGNLLVGTSSDNGAKLYVVGSNSSGSGDVRIGNSSNLNMLYVTAPNFTMGINAANGGSVENVRFYNAGTTVGTISTNGSSTSYNTTSDYRLKQDFKEFNGISLINKIKTYDFEFKSDNTRMYGVIAHELQEVIPYMVFGEKDGEYMQSVDYSKIVPVLVKAIQEQQAQIEELKALINK